MSGSEIHSSLKNTLKAHPEGQTLHSPAVIRCTHVSEQRAAVSHSTTDILTLYLAQQGITTCFFLGFFFVFKTVNSTTESQATLAILPLRTSAGPRFHCLMYQVL